MTSTNSEKTTYTRYLSFEKLSQYCELKTIEALTKKLVLEKQSKANMRALRAFRWALKWKAEGKKDGFHGDRWGEEESPLTENN